MATPRSRGPVDVSNRCPRTFHVRIARGEVIRHAVHSCDGVTCTINAVDLRPASDCRWELIYTGENWCSCWMCHWHTAPRHTAHVPAPSSAAWSVLGTAGSKPLVRTPSSCSTTQLGPPRAY